MARTVDDLLIEARASLPHRPTPAQALEAQAHGSLLVDIRGDDQRRAGGLIPGAIALPRNSLEWRCDPASPWRHPAMRDWDVRIILICNEGYQSSLAAATLQQLGLRHATDVDGGFVAWKAAGMPVEPPGGAPGTAGAAPGPPPPSGARWDDIHRRLWSGWPSWYQDEPAVSLELLDALGVAERDAVLDVGGGASALTLALAARGFGDLTVLDCSEEALLACRRRLGALGERVHLLHCDVMAWNPERRYGLWHDRALLHFLTEPADRARYAEVLEAALAAEGAAIIATFAPDGPTHCSGQPVMRYSASQIAMLLGPGFRLVAERTEDHVTPQGTVQRFTWATLRRRPESTSTP